MNWRQLIMIGVALGYVDQADAQEWLADAANFRVEINDVGARVQKWLQDGNAIDTQLVDQLGELTLNLDAQIHGTDLLNIGGTAFFLPDDLAKQVTSGIAKVAARDPFFAVEQHEEAQGSIFGFTEADIVAGFRAKIEGPTAPAPTVAPGLTGTDTPDFFTKGDRDSAILQFAAQVRDSMLQEAGLTTRDAIVANPTAYAAISNVFDAIRQVGDGIYEFYLTDPSAAGLGFSVWLTGNQENLVGEARAAIQQAQIGAARPGQVRGLVEAPATRPSAIPTEEPFQPDERVVTQLNRFLSDNRLGNQIAPQNGESWEEYLLRAGQILSKFSEENPDLPASLLVQHAEFTGALWSHQQFQQFGPIAEQRLEQREAARERIRQVLTGPIEGLPGGRQVAGPRLTEETVLREFVGDLTERFRFGEAAFGQLSEELVREFERFRVESFPSEEELQQKFLQAQDLIRAGRPDLSPEQVQSMAAASIRQFRRGKEPTFEEFLGQREVDVERFVELAEAEEQRQRERLVEFQPAPVPRFAPRV